MDTSRHPVFAVLRAESHAGPVVVAHRGDSERHPENTIPAFASARRMGVRMQEFDVRCTRDRVLVCVHDDSLDRTTDAPRRLGPGALVAETSFEVVRGLDAGVWRGSAHAGTTVPTLAEVLDLLAPGDIAMIEHKAGESSRYLEELARRSQPWILQSFDWEFLAGIRRTDPNAALALLGPVQPGSPMDGSAIDAARRIDAGMLHWHARDLQREHIESAHAAGLLVCSYTTDDDLGFLGGAALGLDAMCTNRPGRMLDLRSAGELRLGRS